MTKSSGENSRISRTGVRSRTLRVCLLEITRCLLCHASARLLSCDEAGQWRTESGSEIEFSMEANPPFPRPMLVTTQG